MSTSPPRPPRSGCRASASLGLFGLVLGLGGCFDDNVMFDDDDGGPAATTGDPDPVDSTGAMPGSTGVAESGETGTEPSESTGAVADESTGGPGDSSSTGEGEESGSSTGAMQDESTGSEPALGVDDLQPGDLVVTEVMWNPNCGGDACEWIEILNTTGSMVNLLDLYVQDIDVSAANQGRVTIDVLVEPGAVAVITRGVSFWPYDFEPGAVYGPNPGFNNDQPEAVVIRNSTAVLDETAVFLLDVEEGVAWSLTGTALDAVSNDSAGSWCGSSTVLPTVSTTEFGSPGVINESCAS